MASTDDRIRENRRVLAEITETARTISEVTPAARDEIVALQQTAKHMRTALNNAGCLLFTIAAGGAVIGGLIVAAAIWWILSS